jgi:hypothetical protein
MTARAPTRKQLAQGSWAGITGEWCRRTMLPRGSYTQLGFDLAILSREGESGIIAITAADAKAFGMGERALRHARRRMEGDQEVRVVWQGRRQAVVEVLVVHGSPSGDDAPGLNRS